MEGERLDSLDAGQPKAFRGRIASAYLQTGDPHLYLSFNRESYMRLCLQGIDPARWTNGAAIDRSIRPQTKHECKYEPGPWRPLTSLSLGDCAFSPSKQLHSSLSVTWAKNLFILTTLLLQQI